MLAIAVFVIFASAGMVFGLERDAGGPIDDFGTALWWAIVTITTVGYGDAYPVTNEGRGVAAFLMIVGISLFGYITANIAAFLAASGAHARPDSRSPAGLLTRQSADKLTR